jgi:ring-1,2-phenylacetyl-CoA epoxidase subunit PaaE
VAKNSDELIGELSGKIAIRSILFAFALFCGHISVFFLCVNKTMPVIFGMAINTVLCYYMYTIHHESTHGNISGRGIAGSKIDKILGYIAGFFMDLSFYGYSKAHIEHHKNTNKQTDSVDSRFKNPIGVIPRYIRTITSKFVMLIPSKKLSKRIIISFLGREHGVRIAFYYRKYPEIAKLNRITLLVVISSFLTGYGFYVLLLWYIPANLYVVINQFLHDWLPHNVYDEDGNRSTGQYLDTRILTWPGSHIITCAQDYHLIHHLHQNIPFFLYKKAFNHVREEIEKNGGNIQHINITGIR